MSGLATRVKTLRLPEDVCQTIEQFPGDNFTAKFVAAARLLGRDREKLEKQLQEIEHLQQQKCVALADMDKLLRKRDSIVRSLDEISWKISGTVQACKVLQEASAELLGSSYRK